MKREIFSDEHHLFREQFQRFVQTEVEPHVAEWNEAGITPRCCLTLPQVTRRRLQSW